MTSIIAAFNAFVASLSPTDKMTIQRPEFEQLRAAIVEKAEREARKSVKGNGPRPDSIPPGYKASLWVDVDRTTALGICIRRDLPRAIKVVARVKSEADCKAAEWAIAEFRQRNGK